MGVVQFKWPNQYDSSVVIDYREHYKYGDSLLTWDESNEEVQYLSMISKD